MSAGADGLVIGPADPRSADAARLIARLTADLAERYGDDGAGDFAPEDVLVPRSVFLVGRLNGRPVACGALRPVKPAVAEVKRMYVEPDARGRGIARRLLAELEGHARSMGYAAIRLETGVKQPESIRLYESAGCQRIANYGHYKDDPRSVCFEKHLVPVS